MHLKIKSFSNMCNELSIQLQYAKEPCPTVTPWNCKPLAIF
jgi:hypothetical protein